VTKDTTLEQALRTAAIQWAREQGFERQTGYWPLRGSAGESEDGKSTYIHVHDDYTWLGSVRRTKAKGLVTVELPEGTKIVWVKE
jgi:hypothetical protein